MFRGTSPKPPASEDRYKALSDLRVIQNCPADWSRMSGDEQVRFCGKCEKNVYNLSAMSREEASELIRQKEGHACVRYFLRPDGKVMTSDCPKSVKRRVVFRTAFAGVLSVFGLGFLFTPVFAGAIRTPLPRQLESAVEHYDQYNKALKVDKDHESRAFDQEMKASYLDKIRSIRTNIREAARMLRK